MENKQKRKENRSMYLYTALIFVVALLLIIMAFFGQTNITKLGNRASEYETPSPEVVTPAPVDNDEFAKISNLAAELDAENKTLKSRIEVTDKLLSANAHVKASDFMSAQTVIETVDAETLTDTEKILYDEILIKLIEGKEQ